MEYIKLGYDEQKGLGTLTCRGSLLSTLRDAFSVFDPASKAKRRFSNRKIPTRKYAITQSGQFEVGLVYEIRKWLNDNKVEYKFDVTPEFLAAYDSRFSFSQEVKLEDVESLSLVPRDYQTEGVYNALKYGSGTFVFPTASGKTLFMAMTIHNILKRQPDAKFLLVTLTSLVEQTHGDFVSYGMNSDKMSMWTGTHPFSNTQIVVAGSDIVGGQLYVAGDEIDKAKKRLKSEMKRRSQLVEKGMDCSDADSKIERCNKTLEKMIKREAVNIEMLEYFANVDVLMIDEVHQFKKGNVISDLAYYVPTKHKFGYTGTLPTDNIDVWTIIGRIGPVRQTVQRDTLVAQGSIADVEIKVVGLGYKDDPKYERELDFSDATNLTKNFLIEVDFLINSEFRNSVIAKITSSVSKNCLVIVHRIAHGEKMLETIKKACPNKEVYFIQGEVEDEVREEIKACMEKGDNVVCIAISKIFSTGVNIKNLHYIVFANAGKARVSIIQSIGRGARMMNGKSKVCVFDIYDKLRYGERHYAERKQIYDTEGFKYETVSLFEGC